MKPPLPVPTLGACSWCAWTAASLLLAGTAAAAAPREPLPWRISPKLTDAMELTAPANVRLEGFLGFRVSNNALHRLRQVDEAPLLAGFRQRPGSHPWIGEHVGKWMHAATLAWSYTGDEVLKQKLDRVAAELLKCQEPEGYLGTYAPDQRFGLFPGADWDVWSHKYNLLGLLTYHQYTGDPAALEGCRRMGDLLLRTFGPGQKSLLSAGTHVGMAATSVLEPVVLLYRATGDPRYLEFCRSIVAAWNEPGGPRIIDTLLREKSVARTANAKAYEMLSNLVGLCELARATGDRALLDAVLIAWQDVVERRLYLTGSASQGEHFKADHELPNGAAAHVAETCVTVTWIQLNSQLLRLTGHARFAHELEKTFVNHLAAAQRPDGAQWCYFTPLEGTKDYGPGINCCVSSGPRGMALIPMHAFLRRPGGKGQSDLLILNLYESARTGMTLDSQNVVLELVANPARPGSFTLTLHPERSAWFEIAFRTPPWSTAAQVQVGGTPAKTLLRDGWTVLPAQAWKDGNQVSVLLPFAGQRVEGTHGNAGRTALTWGPAVLAYDEAFNRDLGPPSAIGLADPGSQPPVVFRPGGDFSAFFEAPVRSTRKPGVQTATFVLFADAGSQGSRYQVWLRSPGTPLPENPSAFAQGRESRSHPGNVAGSILDGDPESFVVTFNAQPQAEAWFAVSNDAPVEIRRVIYRQGRTFHDGGWFDASTGKPRVEIQRTPNGPWEKVGELAGYPATTGTDRRGLQESQPFELLLPGPTSAVAVRVIGRPAGGDDPRQAFASCAELEVLGK